MPNEIIPLQYSHLLGALLSAQVPYMFMIACGYFFAKVGLLQKEGLISFAKMNIEIFLPIYLFIQVCRSTFTYNFEEYGVIILSFLFYFVISFVLCFLYAFLSKMDLRYRFTFISITCFVDLERLHYLYINSMCFLLKNKLEPETIFCEDILVHSNIHVFFQGIVIWYLSFNLIRMDRAYQRQATEVWERVSKENLKSEAKALNTDKEDRESNNYFNDDGDVNDKKEDREDTLTNEEKLKVKEIYQMYSVPAKDSIEKDNNNQESTNQNENENNVIHVFARQSFYNKISKYHKASFFKNDSIWKEIIYILLRSPLIGLFVGFVVGFIRVIREWIYNTTTPVYLFFDTFNTIGNCNILLGFLMIGANLVEEEGINKSKNVTIKIRAIDYIAHFLIKIIIMPFLGVAFSSVIDNHFFEDNRILNWACFIQWILPTSIDVVAIVQLKNINYRFVCICIFVQYVCQMLLNNLINVPCFLKVVDTLDD